MKVYELIATLLTLPQEAKVYTEQWNSNEAAEIAINKDEDYVLIGDDLASLIEEAPAHTDGLTRVGVVDTPAIYIVNCTSLDDGALYNYYECYNTLTAARACFNIWVEKERHVRAKCRHHSSIIKITDKEDYYHWCDEWDGNYSEIWIQREVIWDKIRCDNQEETK